MSKNNNIDIDAIIDDIHADVITSFNKFIEKILKDKQSEHQKENFPDATFSTCMDCVICGGSYTIRSRSSHNSTKKHKRCINKVKNYYITK